MDSFREFAEAAKAATSKFSVSFQAKNRFAAIMKPGVLQTRYKFREIYNILRIFC